ncbi:MAG TPA: UDP-glucose/GDP-mannose dehydrogenase family protein [Candidatus Acidoferrales bacterium]|nr:UDP-glucose/GDP-mannose dehydrogenase family protein [Candidatus Acidoferrales bacterium]
MTITFVGHGYVGLVTAAVFADLGNTVWVIGHTPEKIEKLKKGIIPIYEPGLEELVKKNVDAGRLLFTLDYDPAIPQSDAIFIAVGTPPKSNGEANLSVVLDVAEKIGKHLDGYSVVATKSTVPVATNIKVQEIINDVKPEEAKFDYASVPEFLREGQALSDTFYPDRVVIGADAKRASDLLTELHQPILENDVVPNGTNLILTNIPTAEMIKYASNAFLATKISYANAIAYVSELTGANGLDVLEGIGLDKRIGNLFLQPGAGYGGSCFPKDVRALIEIAREYGYDFRLLKDVEEINREMMLGILKKARKLLDQKLRKRTVAVLGLAFKPKTDDMRDAPAITIIRDLLEEGVTVKVFDPIAMENAKRIFAKEKELIFAKDPYDAVKDTELLIIVTDWNEFKELNLKKVKDLMKSPNLIDGRNIYNPEKTRELGFTYVGVGR